MILLFWGGMSALHRVTLLGVPIDAVTSGEAVARLHQLLNEPGSHHVMTPNSEMLVESVHNIPFRETLYVASMNLPDSAGLLWAARMTGQSLPERVTGVDTVEALCATLDSATPVFLLGAAPGVAAKTAIILQSKNPRLVIAGTFSGSPRSEEAVEIIRLINAAGPRLLLVAFGAPAQDLWIAEHLMHCKTVRVAMGVGGTFDFITGVQKRAPAILRQMGLEWLWRVVREPKRIGRIWRAVVVFPMMILRYGKRAP